MKQSVYLGETGLTMSSGTYLCNLAKETIKLDMTVLKNISFTNKSVELINGEAKVLRKGFTALHDIKTLISRIGQNHAFCAWVREAIKAKEELLCSIDNMSIYDYASEKGIILLAEPEKEKQVTEEDIISEMNIKERNQYLYLEAMASAFGTYIHPEGSVSAAREDVILRTQVPHDVDGEGRDMVIYSYEPSISINDMNGTFLELQNEWRDYEKQLNAIKFSIKEKVNQRNLAINQKYQKERQAYVDFMDNIRNDLRTYILETREKASNLKIVVPEKLKSIYEYLESL